MNGPAWPQCPTAGRERGWNLFDSGPRDATTLSRHDGDGNSKTPLLLRLRQAVQEPQRT